MRNLSIESTEAAIQGYQPRSAEDEWGEGRRKGGRHGS